MDIFELYKKCIKGECTPEEASVVENWLKENPGAFESEMLLEMQEMGGDKPLPSGVREEMLAHFSQRGLGIGTVSKKGRLEMLGSAKYKMARWMAAAAVVAAILIGGWIYESNSTQHRTLTWSIIENNGNGVKLVILPDSSRIWLNAFAKIRYAVSADKQSDRMVELTGEAYFKVLHQTGQSFTVQTDNVRTRVLGTEFNVEAYSNENMVRIYLQEGKVQVNCLDGRGMATDVQLLEPGQAATYQKGDSRLFTGKTISGKPQAWINEGLVLNDAALGDALLRIGRKYNRKIEFDVGEAKRFRHITAYYRKMDVEQVLKQLGFTCDFNFKKDNNIYKIFFGDGRGAKPLLK